LQLSDLQLSSGDTSLVALVTGANRGIGLETCRQLADLGLRVILTSRDPEKGRNAAARIGKNVVYYPLDVADPEQIQRLRVFVMEEFGRLDVIVNNAGVYLDKGSNSLSLTEKVFRDTLDINLFGAFRMCQAFIPTMKERGYGRVVNVSSRLGSLVDMKGGSASYRISKTGLNALTRVLADEVRNYNVKINSAHPGRVKTDMGGPEAPRSIEAGADTIVWLATLADDGPTGGFFHDRKQIPW